MGVMSPCLNLPLPLMPSSGMHDRVTPRRNVPSTS
jgi:hypothetical protein